MTRKRILVLTSTFPQFANDPRGSFVSRYWKSRLEHEDLHVRVLAPRSSCSSETSIDDLEVRRFSYAPKRLSTLTGRFGILENLREAKWRWSLVPLFFRAQAKALHREIVNFSPDLVAAHMFVPCGLAVARACLRKNIQFQLFGHGSDLDLLLKSPPWLVRTGLGSLVSAERWFLPSQEKLERVRLHFLASKIVLPPLHVEYMKNAPMTICERSFSRNAAVQKHRVFSILYMGRLTKQKGVDVLLRAVAGLESRPALEVAGDGPERKNLIELAQKLGLRVRFHGFVNPQLRDQLYDSATVICVPSRIWRGMGEGAPLVVCEAQNFGKYIVASSIGGIPELCAGYSRARLVPYDNIPALTQALAELSRRSIQFASPTESIESLSVGAGLSRKVDPRRPIIRPRSTPISDDGDRNRASL